jgi:hypothetical protein
MTHRTLSPDAARECERRIANYHEIQAQLDNALQKSLEEFLGSLQKK